MAPLDIMLRDRFVCCVGDENLQQCFFAEPKLTFQKAYNMADMAVRTESAAFQKQDLKTTKTELNKLSKGQTKKRTPAPKYESTTQRCFRCIGVYILQLFATNRDTLKIHV